MKMAGSVRHFSLAKTMAASERSRRLTENLAHDAAPHTPLGSFNKVFQESVMCSMSCMLSFPLLGPSERWV